MHSRVCVRRVGYTLGFARFSVIIIIITIFAWWFIGVLGKEFSILGELCSHRRPKSDESASHREVKFSVGRDTVIVTLQNTDASFVKSRGVWT